MTHLARTRIHTKKVNWQSWIHHFPFAYREDASTWAHFAIWTAEVYSNWLSSSSLAPQLRCCHSRAQQEEQMCRKKMRRGPMCSTGCVSRGSLELFADRKDDGVRLCMRVTGAPQRTEGLWGTFTCCQVWISPEWPTYFVTCLGAKMSNINHHQQNAAPRNSFFGDTCPRTASVRSHFEPRANIKGPIVQNSLYSCFHIENWWDHKNITKLLQI